ncbi:unnamed protein product [Lymnaea stagnalis]|uniref:Uncharacterized protein n=1 Tax=Lymnaea stagnalis TaxID=6523 RepID=A0AAV2I339_LYMST
MYYAGLPANGSPNIAGQGADKPGIYMPAPSPYGPTPTGYPPSQPGLPPGLAPRYAAAPQAYAVVSNTSPTGYTTISPAYHSLPYSSLQGIPTSTHAYISAAQYPGMSYQTAMGPRSAPPSHYPVQAGAPLIAGYSPMPGAMPAPTARSYPVGHMAAYPPGYPLPAGSAPIPYHGATAFGPPY